MDLDLTFPVLRRALPPSLIGPDDAWSLWAVIIIGVAIAIWLEQTYRWAAKVSGPLLALIIAMVLSNLKIMPSHPDTPTYDVVWSFLVPLAVPLLLFKANIFRIVRDSGPTFIAFHVATVGTLIGALLAHVMLRSQFEESAQMAGIMAASYIGGGVNFLAVTTALEAPAIVTNPLLVADNFIMAGMFAVLFAMAGAACFRKWYPHPHIAGADGDSAKAVADEHWKRKEIGLLDIAKALAVAFAIAAAAAAFSKGIKGDNPNAVQAILGNMYVIITLLSVVVATLFHRQLDQIHGSQELGTYLLYVLLFVIGLPADLVLVLGQVPLMFLFCLIIAVNATLGGPPTAMAMAMSMGWSRLVLPALLVGIWGYVIGTGLGVAISHVLAGMN